MGLQCFKELFPFCKTTFEVRKSSCDLVNILGSAVSLALIHPWFQTCTNSGSSVNLASVSFQDLLLWNQGFCFLYLCNCFMIELWNKTAAAKLCHV